MEKQYVAPELKLAGDATKVVLGLVAAGFDYLGQDIGGDLEFQTDDDVNVPGVERAGFEKVILRERSGSLGGGGRDFQCIRPTWPGRQVDVELRASSLRTGQDHVGYAG